MLKLTVLLAVKFWKLVPVIVTDVPGPPTNGENPVIVGAEVKVSMIKDSAELAEPLGATTMMGALVAPFGTVTTS
jgi:hypothetical protein